jgi:hypothetical protein
MRRLNTNGVSQEPAIASSIITESNNNNDSEKIPCDATMKIRRCDNAQRRHQYQLVADEIASVLNDEQDGEEDKEDEQFPEDSTPSANSHLSQRTLMMLRRSEDDATDVENITNVGVLPKSSADAEGGGPFASSSLSPAAVSRRKRRRRPRPPRPFLIKDAEFNAYSLFDFSSKKTQQQQQHQPKNIYAKTYDPSTLFTPILVFLSMTFVLLIVIRILVSLVTLTVGMTILMVAVTSILQECLHRPIQFLNRIHQRPCQMWVGLAIITSLFRHHGGSMAMVLWYQAKDMLLATQDMVANDSPTCSTSVLSWIVGPCLQGFLIGITIGSIWLLLLGTASNPTQLTQWIIRRVWKQLIQRSYYKCLRSMYQRKAQLQQQQKEQEEPKEETNKYDRECMICLEVFGGNDWSDSSVLLLEERRQYLPCLHGFHAKCLIQWLHIKSTCPICRVQVPSTVVATLTTSSAPGMESRRRERTHPAEHELLYSMEED